MTTTAVAARRRHAHQIATCVRLIRDIGAAACAVYEPAAAAPAGPVAVSMRGLALLTAGAPAALDYARRQDRKQWPDQAAAGDRTAQRSLQARAVLAAAENALDRDTPAAGPGAVPLSDPGQQAAAEAIAAAADVNADHPGGHPSLKDVRAVAKRYGVPAVELLQEAARLHTDAAALELQDAVTRLDPSDAVELALDATRHLTVAVHLLSVDV